jgi:exonuclease III
VRGINSSWKWDLVRNSIADSQCDIVCLQETKKEVIDVPFHRKVSRAFFDSHVFLPSVGASGGILIAWKESLFYALKSEKNSFSLTMEFCSKHNNASWLLTCIYAPCTLEGKIVF